MKKNVLKKLNPLTFLSIMNERKSLIKRASEKLLPKAYPINLSAKKLHPSVQFVKIAAIKEHSINCKTYTLVPDESLGTTELAYFGAGKYITVFLEIDGFKLTRAYSLSSSPKVSLTNGESKGKYEITVKWVQGGLASKYILDNWKVGTKVQVSAPEGNFEYIGLRDAKTVVAVAGGSGITPFLSMANAIADGDEDFNLIILYGVKNQSEILFKNEFDTLEKDTGGKVKVVYVLSDEEVDTSDTIFEKGFITGDLISKYTKEKGIDEFSVFLCGPQAMYKFVDGELEKMGIQKKYIRYELFGEIHSAKKQPDYAENVKDVIPEEIKITVRQKGDEKTVVGKSDDTILQILEANGVTVPSRCRSGECGWCHSYLKSGKVYIPKHMDFRRKADEEFGYVHPCCTFALSDIEIECF